MKYYCGNCGKTSNVELCPRCQRMITQEEQKEYQKKLLAHQVVLKRHVFEIFLGICCFVVMVIMMKIPVKWEEQMGIAVKTLPGLVGFIFAIKGVKGTVKETLVWQKTKK